MVDSKYIIVSSENLQELVDVVNERWIHWYVPHWGLTIERTNETFNVVLAESGSVSWGEWGWSYSGNATWTWTPTRKNVYHQVLVAPKRLEKPE